MNYKWSIGLMTGTVNDGFIDVAAILIFRLSDTIYAL